MSMGLRHALEYILGEVSVHMWQQEEVSVSDIVFSSHSCEGC